MKKILTEEDGNTMTFVVAAFFSAATFIEYKKLARVCQ